MAQHNREEIYIRGVSRMVTIKHTANRVYFTGYFKLDGEWAVSWTVEQNPNETWNYGTEVI